MKSKELSHITLPSDYTGIESYMPKPRRGSSEYSIPDQNPDLHGNFLQQAYLAAIENYKRLCENNGISQEQCDKGFVIEVKAPDGISLEYSKLEDMRGKQKLEVVNVKTDNNGNIISAVLYIPPKKQESFTKKVNDYQDISKKTKDGYPRNRELFNTIGSIDIAPLTSFWTDVLSFPNVDTKHNWELWLRDGTIESVKDAVRDLDGITISDHYVSFPDRQICTAHCTLSDLQNIQLLTNALTGFRYNRVQSGFFDSMPPSEQKEWNNELLERIDYNNIKNSSVCVLDTGIDSEHPLLKPAIQENAIDSYHPDWGTDDHDGHGTEMAGLALLGDLTPVLAGNQRIDIKHYIESVKVIPKNGKNDEEHIANITEEAVYRAETNLPYMDRVFCLSWTVEPNTSEEEYVEKSFNGYPTVLSAKLDQMSYGIDSEKEWQIDDEKKRLFFVSAGNIRAKLNFDEYPDRNDLSDVEEPAQSWNAITVGAFTNKVWVENGDYEGWRPVAEPGGLSPRSRTSVNWGKELWPIKPDIVLEGGNYIGNDNYPPEDHPDLSVLTTSSQNSLFCHSVDTSSANAQAARLAAMIKAKYPSYWPETVRGLLIHSARWNSKMLENNPLKNVRAKINLLRRYGYGAPNENIMLSSFNNHACIVIQDYLKPFILEKDDKGVLRNYASYGEIK